jgi:hypothetical protein
MAIISPLKKRWLWQCWRTETNGSCATGGGGTSLLYKEVFISSAEILTIGTSPIPLLPVLSAGQYYDNIKINLEYNHVTTPYTDPNGIIYIQSQYGQGPFSAFIATPVISNSNSSVTVVIANPNRELPINTVQTNNFIPSSDILDTSNSDLAIYMLGAKIPPFNPSGGDGTMLVKIWYEIRSIGSEL